MKRLVIILLCCWLFIPALRAQQTASLLDAADLKAANDSILAEAYQLYLHEKVAWVLEDVFYGSKSSAINMVDGWLPITEDGISVKGIFYNKEKTQALFEANFNIQTGETSAKDAVRDLTKEEIDEINEHLRIIDAVQSLDAEDLPYCPEGCTFNVDIVSIGENLHRVYYILGTSQHGIIPFGCDFSYDCDSEGNIKAFRRYHKTYIPAVLKMEDGSAVREVFHSHLSICPLMAPTDIALFLLYGYEAGLSGFKVLSTVYHCLFAFDPETYEIRVEQMANTDTAYQPLFIVDGYPCKGINGLTQQRFSSSEEALNLFLEFYPFLVKNDIDSINIIREEDFGKHNMYPRKPIDTIIISTKKASQIKLFFLNGNLKKRHRGIELGALLTDREVLQKRIQKQWGINPDRITDIVVHGKVILITTDK